ncbi:zinc ribbon domain-containing protein [Baekduia sp. Peel2402]|uniref:zinc ribbon domain-containing protein n=1 Tax=Baekduia sp. Peel2402 TaxID=3458296 RepID=UPI00403E4949
MSTRVDVEEIEFTKGERLLAVLLAGFLLVGGLWGYSQLHRAAHDPSLRSPHSQLTVAQQSILARRDTANELAAEAADVVRVRRRALADHREAYRTALDEGRRDSGLARRYRQSQRRYADAQATARQSDVQARAARAVARPVDAELRHISQAQQQQVKDQRQRNRLTTFGLRLVLVLGLLIGALGLMTWQRRRRSRWAPTGYAGVGAAGVLALIMGIDYTADWFDFVELGPLVISAGGAIVTLVALAALQRHLARRLPGRRIRQDKCPFCGHPARRGEHCEGCGRSVVAPCAQCHAPRRVGTAHCAGCGQI